MNSHAFLLCALAFSAAEIPQSFAQNPADDRVDRVLHGLRPQVAIKGRPAVRWTMAERMAVRHIPGASIAIIDSGRVVWAGGFGVKETGITDSVTISTLFQAQSISKPIAATATLRLVDAGKLSLDEDVNTYLKSWKVPENQLQLQEKVTLRRILSHSAGLTVGGFAGYRSGDSIPTLLQILNGEKPANNPPIRVDTVPGSISRYSGGGAVVMQQLLIDVTGEPFPSLMKRLVLEPIGMTLSTYEQPLPEPRRKEAASGHDGAGMVVKGKWPIEPELAAGGLWTTPTELAKWALEITNAWSGRSSKLLSKKMATEMLTVQKPPFGLGLYLEGRDQALSIRHAGSIWGFRALLVMYPAVGKGAVVMTNADQGEALIREVITSIAAEYHWPADIQSEREVVAALTTRQLDGLVGTYTLPPGPSGAPVYYEVSREGGQLFAELKGLGLYGKGEIHAASADSFFTTSGLSIVFTRDSSGRAVKVKMGEIEGIRTQEKTVTPDLKALSDGKGGTIPADATLKWVENVKGKPALKVQSKKDDSVILLDRIEFTNGVIEFDALGQSGPSGSNFLGFAFRVVNAKTHDAVYFRPFNFRAEEAERKAHAVQYISHPKYRWQVLRKDKPGQYEKPIISAPDGDAWFHVRIVVEKPKVNVYVNDGKEPSLVVEELSDRKGGGVGLWVGPGQGGYFANLKITPAN
jgi:CubicO group peptidase (beta-lactamase class C family)